MSEPRREPMQLAGKAKKVTIFVGHAPGEHGKAPYLRILERLQAEGAAGATAFKAVAAFGARAHVHTITLADVAPHLPAMIVWIDSAERVERILPGIWDLVAEGLITIEDTEVLLQTTTAMPELPRAVPVSDVMTQEVVAVHPETPLSDLVADLVRRRFRAVPVVDAERRVVGMVTSGDFVRRGLAIRPELLRTCTPDELQTKIAHLADLETREVMTYGVVTVPERAEVRRAGELMRKHHLRRLPVVDAAGRLVGLVSRVDLLRVVAPATAQLEPASAPPRHVDVTEPVRAIMTTDVPTVRPDTPLPEVIAAVLASPSKRAVVIDDARHVVGIIRDVELSDRVNPSERPNLLSEVTSHLPFLHGPAHGEERRDGPARHLAGYRASDVMLTDIVLAREDEPVRDVLATMLQEERTIAPVVNAAGELVGVVQRADILDGLLEG